MPSLDLFSGSISQDEDSWTWQFTIDVDYADWLALKPANAHYPEINLHVRGADFALMVEGATRKLVDTKSTFSLSGRGISAKLDGKTASSVTKSWTDSSAQQIISELCSSAGVALVYDVVDFPIKHIEGQGRYPIEIINQILSAIKAVIQTRPDGSLYIRSKRLIDPKKYFSENMVSHTLTDLDDYETLDERWDDRDNYSVISVGNGEVTDDQDSTKLTLASVDDLDDNGDKLSDNKIIHLYSVPFIESIDLEHSAAAALNIFYQGVVTEKISETVEVVDGQSSVSKPCYGNISASYVHDDLGQITINYEATDLTTEIKSHSLIKIEYDTRYHQFVAERTGDDEQLQVYAEVVE